LTGLRNLNPTSVLTFMNYRSILSILFAAVLFAGSPSAADAQEVSVTFTEGPVKRGSTVKGTVLVSIPEGLHVNSNKPSSEYLIATTVRLSGDGIKVRKIDYPDGANRKFQFSETELNVYEGDISIPFSVSILKSFKGKQLSMKALVRYQACTEEICYPPRNKKVIVTTRVR
jgi:hypothetical protein